VKEEGEVRQCVKEEGEVHQCVKVKRSTVNSPTDNQHTASDVMFSPGFTLAQLSALQPVE
jgi:hypothetical protein